MWKEVFRRFSKENSAMNAIDFYAGDRFGLSIDLRVIQVAFKIKVDFKMCKNCFFEIKVNFKSAMISGLNSRVSFKSKVDFKMRQNRLFLSTTMKSIPPFRLP